MTGWRNPINTRDISLVIVIDFPSVSVGKREHNVNGKNVTCVKVNKEMMGMFLYLKKTFPDWMFLLFKYYFGLS